LAEITRTSRRILVALAARINKVRLIDNIIVLKPANHKEG
jgi:pantothenate synthetase